MLFFVFGLQLHEFINFLKKHFIFYLIFFVGFCRLPGKNSSQSKLSDDDQEPTTDSSFIALCNDGVVQRVTNEEGKHCRGVATLLPSNDVVIARQFGEENALLRRDVQRLNVRNNRLIEQLREKSARLSAVHAKCCQLEIRVSE